MKNVNNKSQTCLGSFGNSFALRCFIYSKTVMWYPHSSHHSHVVMHHTVQTWVINVALLLNVYHMFHPITHVILMWNVTFLHGKDVMTYKSHMIWYDMTSHDMMWCDVMWFDIWHDMIYQCSIEEDEAWIDEIYSYILCSLLLSSANALHGFKQFMS